MYPQNVRNGVQTEIFSALSAHSIVLYPTLKKVLPWLVLIEYANSVAPLKVWLLSIAYYSLATCRKQVKTIT